jgi:hypothetical protein
MRHGDFALQELTYFAGAAGAALAVEAELFAVVAGLAAFLCFFTIFLPLSAELLLAAGACVVAGAWAKPATAKAREVAITETIFFILGFLFS